jgi:hypothetical protein
MFGIVDAHTILSQFWLLSTQLGPDRNSCLTVLALGTPLGELTPPTVAPVSFGIDNTGS